MKTIRTLALILLTLLPTVAAAQISLVPSFVFIDERSGVGNLMVINNGTSPYEITVNFMFGYPGGDAEGNLIMVYNDSLAQAKYGLENMIRAFPRSFLLQPQQQQTVRIQVLPQHRRNEGFFFTRMSVLAQPQAAEITQEVAEGIGTRISFNIEQITAVFYRRGAVSTGLEIQKLEVLQSDSVLLLKPHLLRTGNAPFLGSMFAKLRDNRGNIVAESQSTTTVYFGVIRPIQLLVEQLPSGKYTLELSFESQRNDMRADHLVQMPRLVHTQEILLE